MSWYQARITANRFIRFAALCTGILLFVFCDLSAQTHLSGIVSDADGEPLVGANVYVVELRQGDATDAEGRYEINDLPAGKYRLQVSYLGYQTQIHPTVVKQGVAKQMVNLRLAEAAFSIEPLTLTATRADQYTPVTHTNLNREELQKNNLGQDVPYLLRWTPSAVVTSDAGTGIGYTGIWIRGADPTRTNVTINGIPLNDAEGQGVYWVDLPDFVSSTEDIQIQRGVGTSTNGTGAFGATVNLNTNKVHEQAYAEIQAGLGSFGTRRGNIRLGSGLLNDRFTVDARLSKIHSDGYIDRARADLDSWYLSASRLGEKSVLRFNAFGGHEITYQAWNGVDASLVDDPATRTSNTAGTERPGEPHDNEVDDYTQTHYQLLWDQQLSRSLSLHLGGHYTKGKGFFEQYKAAQSLENYGIAPISLGDTTISRTDLIRRRWLDNDFYGTIYSLRYQSQNTRWRATLGGGYSIYEGGHFGEVIWARYASASETGDRYYENDARKTDFNIYLKNQYELGYGLRAYLDLQWRQIDYDFIGLDNDLQRVDQSDQLGFFNPKLGLWYRLNERSEVYASFGVAQREPNRNDYVENPPNQRPRPEKLYNPEVGWRYGKEGLQLSANVYYMLYRDQLAANGQINDVGELLRTNVDKSYRLGLELSAFAQITPSIQINANAAWSRNRVQSYTEFLDVYDANFNWLGQEAINREDTPLAFSPDVVAGGELTYLLPFNNNDKHDMSVSWLGKYVGERYLDLSGDAANTLDPYFFSDLRLRYAWRPEWVKSIAVTLLVRNLFDSLYETNGWSYRYELAGNQELLQGLYPQAGRNFLLGVTLAF